MSRKPLDDPKTGIHRAKLWEIAFYALNNTSTNAYMVLVGSISYFLVGIVGVAAVLAGSIVTIMRIWDGVTDPFIGMLVDNTNTKFGKNRPFIIIGNLILFAMTYLMFHIIPEMGGGKFVTFIIMYAIYIVGYTFQCVVTKSAQTCLTNDPTQRPIFTMFDATYNVLLMSVFWPVYLAGTLLPKYTLSSATAADQIAQLVAKNPSLERVLVTAEDGVQTLSGYYNPAMWHHAQLVIGLLAAVFACLAIIGLWRKDNSKYYGLGKAVRIGFKDYADVLAHNRGIQMLVLAASSDKLAMTATSNSSVSMSLYGIILGSFALFGSVSAITGIPVAIFGILGVGYVARRMGQKKCLVVGTWGSIITAVLLTLLILFGHNTGMKLPAFQLTNLSTWGGLFTPSNWSFMGLLYILVYICMKGFSNLSGNIVIPMTADCADYEVYRTGRYVPGLMGTLFSFVDKVISSLGATIVALVYAAVGFRESLPTAETPYTTGILVATLVCFIGMPMIGWILNVVAMKHYPLTKEKMAEIQDEIARIKAQSR
ncbi:MAG: MFS transporter [Clostridia bacterium]|nr:MFS transporter [Clostridia bacterium]